MPVPMLTSQNKSNNGLFNALIKVSLNLWNNLHNQVRGITFYVSYTTYIKSMFINMCIIIYNVLYI